MVKEIENTEWKTERNWKKLISSVQKWKEPWTRYFLVLEGFYDKNAWCWSFLQKQGLHTNHQQKQWATILQKGDQFSSGYWCGETCLCVQIQYLLSLLKTGNTIQFAGYCYLDLRTDNILSVEVESDNDWWLCYQRQQDSTFDDLDDRIRYRHGIIYKFWFFSRIGDLRLKFCFKLRILHHYVGPEMGAIKRQGSEDAKKSKVWKTRQSYRHWSQNQGDIRTGLRNRSIGEICWKTRSGAIKASVTKETQWSLSLMKYGPGGSAPTWSLTTNETSRTRSSISFCNGAVRNPCCGVSEDTNGWNPIWQPLGDADGDTMRSWVTRGQWWSTEDLRAVSSINDCQLPAISHSGLWNIR